MEKFVREYRVCLKDMGSDFCAKHTTLFYDFEECFAQLCLKYNITGYDLDEIGLMWVIGNINMEVLGKMPLWDKTIKIEAWFSEVKKLRAFLEFRIYYENEVIAQGDSCWFVLNQKTRRPVDIDKILANCPKIEETIFETHKKITVKTDDMQLINETEYFIAGRDLDYNGHVNNVAYIEMLPKPKEIKPKKYSVYFLNECFLGEKVNIRVYKTNLGYYFETIKEDGNTACTVLVDTLE